MNESDLVREKSVNRAKLGAASAAFMPANRGVAHNGVARSLKYMAAHYQTPIRLRELVAESGLSRRGFIKAFIKHVGQTPAAMMRQMRIEQAKHLLVTEDLSLDELAKRVGFRSANTFCVAFQRAVGMAPKKFQRSSWLAICQIKRQPGFDACNKPSPLYHQASRPTTVSQAWA